MLLYMNSRPHTRCWPPAHELQTEQMKRTSTDYHGDDGEYPKKNDEEGCHSRCNKANPKGACQQ